MAAAYLGLGSNLGNRRENLRMALRGLTRMARVEAVSALYESDAIGPKQPSFYNAVCRIETGLEPLSLLRFLKTLEHEIGRRPGAERWGPRLIDLDILLYDDVTLESEDLTLPHRRLAERAFVVVPLAEIAAGLRLPGTGSTFKELAVSVVEERVRRVEDAGWDGVLGAGGRIRV